MQQQNAAEKNSLTPIPAAELFDLYAPAVYGKILSIVHKEPIAGKILEKVFVQQLQNKTLFTNPLKPPLISLLNASREKSYKIIKALNIFNECCEGSCVGITENK